MSRVTQGCKVLKRCKYIGHGYAYALGLRKLVHDSEGLMIGYDSYMLLRRCLVAGLRLAAVSCKLGDALSWDGRGGGGGGARRDRATRITSDTVLGLARLHPSLPRYFHRHIPCSADPHAAASLSGLCSTGMHTLHQVTYPRRPLAWRPGQRGFVFLANGSAGPSIDFTVCESHFPSPCSPVDRLSC